MLRFPLAVLVVFIHSMGEPIDVEQLHAGAFSGMAVYDYLRIFVGVVIARSAVPLFFLFSGYLFFKGVERFSLSAYADKLRKRWRTLARPYVLWVILYVLWIMVFKIGGILLHGKPWSGIGDYFAEKGYLHLLWDSNVWNERTTWLGTEVMNNAPALVPFWYVRDLMLMVLLSPVIWWLVKKLRLAYVMLVLALFLADVRVSWYSATIGSAVMFFSLGAYFAIMKQDFTEVLWRWRYVILPLALVLIVVQTATGSAMGDQTSRMVHLWLIVVQSLAIIIVASVLCRYRRLYEWNKALAPTTFFVFASHMFICGYVMKFVTKLTPMSDAWYMKFIDFLISPFLTIALCIAFYAIGKRWMPRLMRLLTGER